MSYDALNRFDVRRQEHIVRSLVRRGVVDKSDASKKMQTMNIRLDDGHRPSIVEHWERYGMTYHPDEGAEVLTIAVGGNPDHVIVIDAADRRYRLKNFAKGEMAIHDDQGQKVHLTRGGIVIESANGVTINSNVTVVGDITHQGNLSSTGFHHAGGGHT